LRQGVAMLLVEHEEAIVKGVTFRIFFEKRSCDLATLPSGLRGSIAGLGDITADLTIGKNGEFSKADVEQLVEKLPSLPGGDYKAELRVQLREQITAHANANE
jgi:hypothetical protein